MKAQGYTRAEIARRFNQKPDNISSAIDNYKLTEKNGGNHRGWLGETTPYELKLALGELPINTVYKNTQPKTPAPPETQDTTPRRPIWPGFTRAKMENAESCKTASQAFVKLLEAQGGCWT